MKEEMISANVAEFRRTKNVYYLAKALLQVVQQGRLVEIVYGVYCDLFCRPSVVGPCEQAKLKAILSEFRSWWDPAGLFVTRDRLIAAYGNEFKVGLLPEDFPATRSQSIVRCGDILIVGEYGPGKRNSRIAIITAGSCTINDFYMHYPGIVHIHAIFKHPDTGEVLVTTGDSDKLLDRWELSGERFVFAKRIRKRLAGHTAIARVNAQYFLGTDFSARPNYIETLGGKKYFFPEKAFRKWVVAFYVSLDRYIVSVNKPVLSSERAITVFDTVEERFIFCDDLAAALSAV